MKCRFHLIISLFLFLCSVRLSGQPSIKDEGAQYIQDSIKVNQLLDESKKYSLDSVGLAISLASQARDLAEQSGNKTGLGYAYKQLGMVQYFQGYYVEAIERFRQSLATFKSINDLVGISNIYNNIGVVFYDQGDNVKALENYLNSLKFAEQAGDSLRILSALNNVGSIYNLKPSTHDKALSYYQKALPICEKLGLTEELGTVSVNIGYIYFESKDYDKAMEYFNKALLAYGNSEGSLNAYNYIGELYLSQQKYDLAIVNHNKALRESEKLNLKLIMVKSLYGLGNVYVAMGNPATALSYYTRAEQAAKEMHAIHELKDLYEKMSMCYAQTKDFSNAFKYQSLYSNVKDTLYNIEQDKKLGSLQFDFDLQKKQGEINLLTKNKELNELQIKRQRFAKNAFAAGLGLVFLIALLIFRNYRAKVRTNKILDQQKAQIETLLLNILPEEVAQELQQTGQATPRYYEKATVLFTDFKSFSKLADALSPQQVVSELNECFMAFDEIMVKHGLEKIKTIGDSYMCAGGIPTEDQDHVFKIIKAALDMQAFISERNVRRAKDNLEPWDIRVGVHSGPLVAGVVGMKKYAYDIWGSTVNVASRMESNGEPGRINVSSATHELIKHKYRCSYRGKISAKNIGDVDMYFVEEEIAA